MNNKVALTWIVLFAIAFLFFSCGLNPFPFGGDIPPTPNVLSKKDSLAVRAILDANGLDTVKVKDVIELQNSSVGIISLDSLGLTRFVLTNAFDSLKGGISLNISYSQIDTLIILDTIHQNLTIRIYYTKLQSIPEHIALLTGNIDLYLPNDNLQYISPEILKCNVDYINVRYNHLISVPDSIAALLTSKDGSWQSYQTP